MNEVKQVLSRLVSAVKVGDATTAHHCLEQLLKDKPPLKSSWLGVAKMAMLSGEVTFAQKALETFVPNTQDPVEEKLQRLAALIQAGKITQAFDEALILAKTESPRPEIFHFLSTVALQLGKMELAVEYAEMVLEQWPTSGQAWLILASTKKIQSGDTLIERMIDIEPAVNKTKNPQSNASFYAAMSKMYFDFEEVELSFEYATKANDSISSMQKYNDAEDSQNMRFIESQFTNQATETQSKRVVNSDNPIFIVGLPRSGTSLLEQILCHHSNIIDGGEFSGIERATRSLTKGEPIGSRAEHFDSHLVDQNIDKIRKVYLRYAHQRFGNNGIIVDKSMNNNRYLWLIKRVFPNAPIIFIKREPSDSAWSCFRTHFSSGFNWSNNLSDIGTYFGLETRLSKLWLKIYESSVFSMSYEELVTEPERVVKSLCDFCGIEYEKQMLDFHLSNRPVFTASVAQVRENLHQQAVGLGQKVEKHLQPFVEQYKKYA